MKMAVCGYAGAGKTLFASTAPDPLFIFFRENPRIKSIANRHLPHVRLTNDVDEAGAGPTVLERIRAIHTSLLMQDTPKYKTVVIDTGDELYQALKEGRRMQQGGEWNINDWGWLADVYREIINGFIDLPVHLIVLYHLRTGQEDGVIYRELALQGATKDEAPGWFDMVTVLESAEGRNDDGEPITRRFMKAQPDRFSLFLKDHYNALPALFPLSETFVGDFDRVWKLASDPDATPGSSREVLDQIEDEIPEPVKPTEKVPVPSPEQLAAKKDEGTEAPIQGELPKLPTQPAPSKEVTTEQAVAEAPIIVNPADPPTPGAMKELGDRLIADLAGTDPMKQAVQNVTDVLNGTLENQPLTCVTCKEEVSGDIADLSRLRFKQVFCKEHFKAEREKEKT